VKRATALFVSLALAACSGDDTVDLVDAPSGDIIEQVRGLGEVVSVEEMSTQWPGYRYFAIQFDQPVDHDDPDGAHFQQYATLIHRGFDRPTVLFHTGYGNWWYDYPWELTQLLGANQLVIEHRFFRGSRPEGIAAWQHLTIEQSAADHHRITDAMRRIYRGKWLETGASKGGMTSVYHRRFYPDDVDATVAYVAPQSLGAPDDRYEAHIEQLGPPACRQALRDLQVELLTNRRAMLEMAATNEAAVAGGPVYTRVAIPVAVESAVTGIEWSFWQTVGVSGCASVPAPTATNSEVWSFLQEVSAPSDSADDNVAEFEAYYYQAEFELGYPGTTDEHLEGLTMFGDEDYEGAYPLDVTIPPFRAEAMQDVDAWVRGGGERLLFIYGEWDPWTGGMFELGDAQDSLRVVAPEGFHYTGVGDLAPADQEAVLAKLEAWSGVTPELGGLQKRLIPPSPQPPRIPPAVLRALQLRHRSR
jgi:hypothetical protein